MTKSSLKSKIERLALLVESLASIYILVVCLYLIKLKTSEPIGAKFCREKMFKSANSLRKIRENIWLMKSTMSDLKSKSYKPKMLVENG